MFQPYYPVRTDRINDWYWDRIVRKCAGGFRTGKKAAEAEIPAKEKAYVQDGKRGVTALKNGDVTIYIIPPDMKVKYENASSMKRY